MHYMGWSRDQQLDICACVCLCACVCAEFSRAQKAEWSPDLFIERAARPLQQLVVCIMSLCLMGQDNSTCFASSNPLLLPGINSNNTQHATV